MSRMLSVLFHFLGDAAGYGLTCLSNRLLDEVAGAIFICEKRGLFDRFKKT